MKIILLENIKSFGRMGDVKNVADGYARNFLFPRKMAKLATDTAMKEVDSLRKKAEASQKLEIENASKLAEQLKGSVLEFARKATKTGKLYSAVTQEDISESVSKQSGFKIEPNSIKLEEHGSHIKQLGEHIVKVQLAPDITVEIKVIISEEKKG